MLTKATYLAFSICVRLWMCACMCVCVRVRLCAHARMCAHILFDVALFWKLPVSAVLLYIMLLCLSHCLRTATENAAYSS